MSEFFWLNSAQWHRIEPLLPRGRKGVHRVDDRPCFERHRSHAAVGSRAGAIVLQPTGLTTMRNRFNRWSKQELWFEILRTLTGSSGIVGTAAIDRTHVKVQGSASGEKGADPQAIGRSRPDDEAHAPTDPKGRPRVLLLTPGNINHIAMAPAHLADAKKTDPTPARRQELRLL